MVRGGKGDNQELHTMVEGNLASAMCALGSTEFSWALREHSMVFGGMGVPSLRMVSVLWCFDVTGVLL